MLWKFGVHCLLRDTESGFNGGNNMTEEQKKLKESWLQIIAILKETGYNYLYMEDISRVAAVIRKEIGLDK